MNAQANDTDATASEPTASESIRVRLLIHYDGRPFHGWQFQPGLPTVQGELERVLEQISGAHRTLIGSGRTDSGVHATGQVATVTLPSRWQPERLQRALNALLPDTIWIERATLVDFAFHPRFDARRRTYHYRIGTCARARSPFVRWRCWALGEPLDLTVLNAVASGLIGRHSFRAFAKAGQPERGEHCTIESAEWRHWHDDEGEMGVRFTISADRYLHHMVRYLVGTQVAIARGMRPQTDLETLLANPDAPLTTSPPAPPEGLYLARVEYAEPSSASGGSTTHRGLDDPSTPQRPSTTEMKQP